MFKKIMSGRFIIVVSTALTYALIVVATTLKYISSVSPEKLEGFAVGLIMGFAGTAGIIYKSYFDRSDRKTTEV